MKKFFLALLSMLCLTHAAHAGGLESFLNNLSIRARADLPDFTAKVSVQFGVPEVRVKAVLSTVDDPADAFMIFELGRMSRQPTDRVIRVYQTHKAKGWGVLAKELGIKPGSAEFHALKRGDLHFDEGSNEHHGKSKGNGKGKEKKDKHHK